MCCHTEVDHWNEDLLIAGDKGPQAITALAIRMSKKDTFPRPKSIDSGVNTAQAG
jgi:hypothetical protein